MEEYTLRTALDSVSNEEKAGLLAAWERADVDCVVFYGSVGGAVSTFVPVGPGCDLRSLNKALRTTKDGKPPVAFLKTVRMILAETDEKVQEVRGKLRLLEQEELSLRERIRIGREHLEAISRESGNGLGPSISKEELTTTLNAIRSEEDRIEAARAALEFERKNLEEREAHILEVEENLIDRLNELSVREAEIEQREENLADRR